MGWKLARHDHHGVHHRHAADHATAVHTLVMEPVFDRVDELGPGEIVFGFHAPQRVTPPPASNPGRRTIPMPRASLPA